MFLRKLRRGASRRVISGRIPSPRLKQRHRRGESLFVLLSQHSHACFTPDASCFATQRILICAGTQRSKIKCESSLGWVGLQATKSQAQELGDGETAQLFDQHNELRRLLAEEYERVYSCRWRLSTRLQYCACTSLREQTIHV